MLRKLRRRSIYRNAIKFLLIFTVTFLPGLAFSGNTDGSSISSLGQVNETDSLNMLLSEAVMLGPIPPIITDENGEVMLHWTASGDDGYDGQATGYEIRYRPAAYGPINSEQRWYNSTAIDNDLVPSPAGQPDSFLVSRLDSGAGYYFCIKTYDDAGNYSGLSNSPLLTASNFGLTLNIEIQGSGTVIVQPDRDYYEYGELVAAYAQPSPDWEFVHWSGDFESENNPVGFAITDDCNIVAEFTTDFLPGDANGDGSVISSDVTYLISYFAELVPSPNPYLAGDANGNCTVTGSDVTYLVTFFRGIGPSPVRGNCDGVAASTRKARHTSPSH